MLPEWEAVTEAEEVGGEEIVTDTTQTVRFALDRQRYEVDLRPRATDDRRVVARMTPPGASGRDASRVSAAPLRAAEVSRLGRRGGHLSEGTPPCPPPRTPTLCTGPASIGPC